MLALLLQEISQDAYELVGENMNRKELYFFIRNKGGEFGVWFSDIEKVFKDKSNLLSHLTSLIEEGYIIERRPLLFLAINLDVQTLTSMEKFL